MHAAVRFYSRSGNTKKVAEYIAGAAGVKAVSVDESDAAINEPVDILFVGGALYAYGLDKHLSTWLDGIDGSKVRKAVLFSTSWLSKHALDLMRDKLTAKGIKVEDKTLYMKSREVESGQTGAQDFAKQFL